MGEYWKTPAMWRQWRHNESDGVSNHQRLHCLLIWPLCGEFTGHRSQKASNAENVSIWWRHHERETWSILYHHGWGLGRLGWRCCTLKQIPPRYSELIIKVIVIYWISRSYLVGKPQINCGDTYQIWMWSKEYDRHLCKYLQSKNWRRRTW